jgi:hypothetical protein
MDQIESHIGAWSVLTRINVAPRFFTLESIEFFSKSRSKKKGFMSKGLASGQAFEHEADHSEAHEGGDSSGVAVEILEDVALCKGAHLAHAHYHTHGDAVEHSHHHLHRGDVAHVGGKAASGSE